MATKRVEQPWDEWSEQRKLALCSQLCSLEWPDQEWIPYVDGPDSLLDLLVVVADPRGRYWADPSDLARILICQGDPIDALKLYEWRDELLRRGDITILPLAENCYGGTHLVLTLQNRWRFYRWRHRVQISNKMRQYIYDRDGHRCVKCGTTEELTLDHIKPWSRGGENTVENLQTMCRRCNCSKGNRIEVPA